MYRSQYKIQQYLRHITEGDKALSAFINNNRLVADYLAEHAIAVEALDPNRVIAVLRGISSVLNSGLIATEKSDEFLRDQLSRWIQSAEFLKPLVAAAPVPSFFTRLAGGASHPLMSDIKALPKEIFIEGKIFNIDKRVGDAAGESFRGHLLAKAQAVGRAHKARILCDLLARVAAAAVPRRIIPLGEDAPSPLISLAIVKAELAKNKWGVAKPSSRILDLLNASEASFEQFPQLTIDVKTLVFNMLIQRDQVAFALTSKSDVRRAQVARFLLFVARGNEAEVVKMLNRDHTLLLDRADVTDYSGRTFKNISACAYAYWAKDWHMCQVLGEYIEFYHRLSGLISQEIEAVAAHGLSYEQHGRRQHSMHFDFGPLKEAYTHYAHLYDLRRDDHPELDPELHQAARLIGVAQRDVPACVAQQYCCSGFSFSLDSVTPDSVFWPERFDGPARPFRSGYFSSPSGLVCPISRTFWFERFEDPPRLSMNGYFSSASLQVPWFPLVISDTSGLGVNFMIYHITCRPDVMAVASELGLPLRRDLYLEDLSSDFNAVARLDEESTWRVQLFRSRLQARQKLEAMRVPPELDRWSLEGERLPEPCQPLLELSVPHDPPLWHRLVRVWSSPQRLAELEERAGAPAVRM